MSLTVEVFTSFISLSLASAFLDSPSPFEIRENFRKRAEKACEIDGDQLTWMLSVREQNFHGIIPAFKF